MSKHHPNWIAFVESKFFGRTLAILATLVISIMCLVGIAGSKPANNPPTPKQYLSTVFSDHQNLPVRPAIKSPPKVTSISIQPQLETYQGPIEPLPSDPDNPILPVLTTIPTTEPVVFLGIDDGWIKTPEALEWLTQHQLPFTLFLTDNGIKDNYGYFQQLQNSGMAIEDHSLSHPDLSKLPIDKQKAEICGAADRYEQVFGVRPTLFRPPYGKGNQLTIQAAGACGMRAIIMWRAYVEKGVWHFQDNHTHLEPGDIVLMHFTPDFLLDIKAFINQVNADNLQVARLEDWTP